MATPLSVALGNGNRLIAWNLVEQLGGRPSMARSVIRLRFRRLGR
jgi:hypothetical protein